MKLKAWHHTSLAVTDLDKAIEFYRDAFGFRPVLKETGISDEICSMTGVPGLSCDIAMLYLDLTSMHLELIHFKSGEPALRLPLPPGAGHVAFEVDDIGAWQGRVCSLGAIPIGNVTSFPEGLAAYFQEPGGSFFELEELSDATWARG